MEVSDLYDLTDNLAKTDSTSFPNTEKLTYFNIAKDLTKMSAKSAISRIEPKITGTRARSLELVFGGSYFGNAGSPLAVVVAGLKLGVGETPMSAIAQPLARGKREARAS